MSEVELEQTYSTYSQADYIANAFFLGQISIVKVNSFKKLHCNDRNKQGR